MGRGTEIVGYGLQNESYQPLVAAQVDNVGDRENPLRGQRSL